MRQRALSGIAIEIFDDIVNRIENDIVTWGNLFLSGNTIYCDIQFCLARVNSQRLMEMKTGARAV